MAFSQRYFRGDGSGLPPPWLKLIRQANRIEQGFFGEPQSVGKQAGSEDYVEVYEHALVIFPADDPISVKVVSRSEFGAKILKQAYEQLQLVKEG